MYHDRIMRPAETAGRLSISLSTLWRLEKNPEFPAPIRISPNAVGWLESEIQAWIEARRQTSAAAGGAANE